VSSSTGPVSTAEARSAWHEGVAPLLEAFPTHAGDILRAIAFAHLAPFPVPIFITGRPGAGKSTLAHSIGELTGLPEPTKLPRLSLASVRKAAQRGTPLILDDVAPTEATKATSGMFAQIGGEFYASVNSPLRGIPVIVATGEQTIDPLTHGRVLVAPINRRYAPREIYQQLHTDAAAAARSTVHAYLEAQVPHIRLGAADTFTLELALSESIDHDRRRNAALHVGGALLRSLLLDAGALSIRYHVSRDDQISAATRAALRYALANGASFAGDTVTTDWILGRRDRDIIYVIPGEVIPFIRAELDDPDLTSSAIAAALERNYLLYPSRKQGRTVPRSIRGTLTRVWQLTPDLIS
jgi:hypothetical protein